MQQLLMSLPIMKRNEMGFDLFSGFLDLAGLLLGLIFLVRGLRASRDFEVRCELHGPAG
jgi:phosphopantetheine adenylyltransferase